MTPVVTESLNLWPLIIYFLAVLLVVGVMIGGSYLLGGRRRDPVTEEQFESGIVAAGDSDTRLHFSVHFYLVAIFFVIFDLEAVFIFAWAVAFREVGWAGYIEILIFISVLVAGLLYLWLIGALEWRSKRQRIQESSIQESTVQDSNTQK